MLGHDESSPGHVDSCCPSSVFMGGLSDRRNGIHLGGRKGRQAAGAARHSLILGGWLGTGQKPHLRKIIRSAPVETAGMQKPHKKHA